MEQFVVLKLSKDELIEIVNSTVLESLSKTQALKESGKPIKIMTPDP